MKCSIPEISWHNREPVLSVDISPIFNEFYKLATGGGDSHVLIWQISITNIKQEVISDLTRHQKAVNAVRWSPNGLYLASADDDANIIVWQQKSDNIPLLEGDTGDKEIWIVYKVLRGHKEDIYDICWSVSGFKLLSGSIDNTSILWDLSKGKMEHILSDHKGFVQGVAWDPKDQIVATISTDRICRIFDTTGKQIKARIHKGGVPVSSMHYLHEKTVKYFYDDTFKSFFRRLQFSPDGLLLIVPSGHMESEDCNEILNATLIFTMDGNWNEPAAIIPLPKQQCSTVIRCCPVLFELHDDGPDPVINLAYRMIFAIGTDHDVILYDTQQLIPFARFQNIHYTRLTDLTWSNDGLLLIASSTDGFCALITFKHDELGIPYVKDDSDAEDNPMDMSGCEELIIDKDENVDTNNKSNKDKEMETAISESKQRSSFIKEWAIKTPKKIKLNVDNDTKNIKEVVEVSDDDDPKQLTDKIKKEINKLIPRRQLQNIESGINKLENKVVQPIAVKRKLKGTEATVKQETENEVKNEKGVWHSTDIIVQPIAVRRKPREYENFKQDTCIEAKCNEIKPKVENENQVESDSLGVHYYFPYGCDTMEIPVKSPIIEKQENNSETRSKKPRNENSNVEQKPDGLITNYNNCTQLSDRIFQVPFPSTNKDSLSKMSSDNMGNKPQHENDSNITNPTTVFEHHIDISVVVKEHTIERPKSISEDEPHGLSSSFTKTRKDNISKIKVSSLVKKSSSHKYKNNPLLKFLNSSGEKKLVKEKNTSVLENIDLTINEDEARDAWKCENVNNINLAENNQTSTTETEDDGTEDFCLQLEDSKSQCSKNDKGKAEDITGRENTVKEGNVLDVTNISDDSNDCDKTDEINIIQQKVPRKVTLTTLSSPKGKNKKTPNKF